VLHVNADNMVLQAGELAELFNTAVCVDDGDASGGGVSEGPVAAAAEGPAAVRGGEAHPRPERGWPRRLMVGLPVLNARQAAARDPSNALMLLRPCAATHRRLLALARAQPRWKHAEMGFLSAAFWGHRLLLPHTVVCTPNALGSRMYAALTLVDCLSADFVGCGSVKFKPWHAADPADVRYGCRDFAVSRGYREAIAAWRAVYAAALTGLPRALASALRGDAAFVGGGGGA